MCNGATSIKIQTVVCVCGLFPQLDADIILYNNGRVLYIFTLNDSRIYFSRNKAFNVYGCVYNIAKELWYHQKKAKWYQHPFISSTQCGTIQTMKHISKIRDKILACARAHSQITHTERKKRRGERRMLNTKKTKPNPKWWKLFDKYAPWRIAPFSRMFNCWWNARVALLEKSELAVKKTPTKPPYCSKWYLRNAKVKTVFIGVEFAGVVVRLLWCKVKEKQKTNQAQNTHTHNHTHTQMNIKSERKMRI